MDLHSLPRLNINEGEVQSQDDMGIMELVSGTCKQDGINMLTCPPGILHHEVQAKLVEQLLESKPKIKQKPQPKYRPTANYNLG